MDLSIFTEGRILLIDKPLTWTSFDVVKKLRNTLRVKKIGHAGTLDPLATGLLLIGTGKFTKKLTELQGLDKTYEGIITIGKTTPSYDLETDFDSETEFGHLSKEDLYAASEKLTGEISQIPPAHSAIKVKGERAYVKARKNEQVELKIRHVKIYRFEINQIDLPDVFFTISCSKGTYIRSMASDFGKLLGVGAYLKSLRRTRIGDYDVKNAENLENFIHKVKEDAAD